MSRRSPILAVLEFATFAGLLAFGAGPLLAQPMPHTPAGAPAAQRVPDRVWSTQASNLVGVPQSTGGVVVMVPGAVLGWGGLPPGGPGAGPVPGQPPISAPGRRGPGLAVPGIWAGPTQVPVPAPAGPATLHTWRTP